MQEYHMLFCRLNKIKWLTSFDLAKLVETVESLEMRELFARLSDRADAIVRKRLRDQVARMQE